MIHNIYRTGDSDKYYKLKISNIIKMSNINKASQNEIQQKSAELKKLRNEERKMKSMLAASNGQLAVRFFRV